MMMDDAAVAVVTHNMAGSLRDCINSLLNQTVPNFRLIIIDDASSDETKEMINNFSDKRIHYKINEKRLGIAASRNKAFSELRDEKIIFFIDADCYAAPNWIKEGLKMFSDNPSVIAVEGLTIYEKTGYRPALSEKSYHMDLEPGMCHTHNCAYKVEVFREIGGFDEENFNYLLEDTDFFYRARKAFPDKEFSICPTMRVVHQKTLWTIAGFFRDTYKVKYFIRIIKRHGRLDFGAGKLGSFILSPKNFILALFPPAILVYLCGQGRKIGGPYDLLFILLYVIKAYYYRLLVWYYAVKEKIFVI